MSYPAVTWHPKSARRVPLAASDMTRIEGDAWREGCELDFGTGYPLGLDPKWMRWLQLHPDPAYLDTAPAVYMEIIERWFADQLGAEGDVIVTPSMSAAMAIVTAAVLEEPGDEVIWPERGYDGWPVHIQQHGGRVRHAQRVRGAEVWPLGIHRALIGATQAKAVVLASPDNPSGAVVSEEVFDEVSRFCQQNDLTLIVDHCLAALSPWGTPVPVLPKLECAAGLKWIVLSGTSKMIDAGGLSLGAIACSEDWADDLRAAASAYFCSLPQPAIYLMASILGDVRFPAYLASLNARIAENYGYLADTLEGYKVGERPQAGCFCRVDVQPAGDYGYAEQLKREQGAVVIPMSCFGGGRGVSTWHVRVSLSRPPEAIERLVTAMNTTRREREEAARRTDEFLRARAEARRPARP